MAGTQINPTFTIEAATSRNFEVWELMIDDWGLDSGAPPFGVSMSYPIPGQLSLPTLAAMSIGPRSTVDRCFVTTDQLLVGSNGQQRRVSTGAPSTFTAAGARTLITDNDVVFIGAQFNPVMVFPSDKRGSFPSSDPSPSGTRFVDATFTALGFANLNAAHFVRPFLHLLCYLRPPTVAPPTKRFPLMGQINNAVANVAIDPGIGIVSVHGRKHIEIAISGHDTAGTGPCNFKIDGLTSGESGQVIPLVASTSTGTITTVKTYTLTDPGIDFLLVSTAAGGAGGANITFNYRADD